MCLRARVSEVWLRDEESIEMNGTFEAIQSTLASMLMDYKANPYLSKQ